MNPVFDGTQSFRGGQHDGILPSQIAADQYRRGVNVTTTNGCLQPRPGFVHQQLTFSEGTINGRTYEQIFSKGKFQSACRYDSNEGSFILAAFSGIIFLIDIERLHVDVITPKNDDRMNQYRRRIHWSEAGRFMVFFDYPNRPMIVETRMARRVDADAEIPEIPTSVLGVFNQNRLWVANAVHEFGASDPVGGINKDAPITFEESLAEASAFVGQFFSWPASLN